MTEIKYRRHILVTGGTRSGKSKFAEDLAGRIGEEIIYLATAQALDDEMKERIKRHQQRRPKNWRTIEEPLEASGIISGCQRGATVLLDCLTLFLSNWFFKDEVLSLEYREEIINQKIASLAKTVKGSEANIIIVSNELGWGLVPENELSRRFRDLAGDANQRIAEVCEEVYLLISGIPVQIKGGRNV
jgi:adenosylcobinamide kinase/adenosylcobinamide-phosphate guanylyltransferase